MSASSCKKVFLSNLDLKTEIAIEKELMRRCFAKSLYLTGCNLLGYEFTKRTHGDTIRCLESTTKKKLIIQPRGSFKSTLGSVTYPIWLLIRNPNLRIMIDSELFANSCKFLREIKGQIESERFKSFYGDWKVLGDWREDSISIAPRTSIKKESSIVCSGIGAGKTGQHFDVIIMDDLSGPSNSNTPEGREKVYTHYRLNHAILEPGGTMIVIGTRYSADDVIGRIIDNEINIKEGLL